MPHAELNISTHPRGPILSFHPLIVGDFNFWAFSAVTEDVLEALRRVRCVIFPQVFPETLYHLARERGLSVFPSYDYRFRFPGKGGQYLLFRTLGLPCPQSLWIPKIASLGPHPQAAAVKWPRMPFVVKIDQEHEGRGLFLVRDERDLKEALERIRTFEREGRYGFLVQEYLPSPHDLRVVIIGPRLLTFWRKLGPDFRTNLAQGGEIIPCPDPELEEKALALARELSRKTGINLAAIDFLFREGEALLNEINYVFGRRALGEGYEELLFEAVTWFLESSEPRESER
ncbi:MAG: glutathione synthase [Thermodesulfobacteria bacterium]|nr:glutathione synthase [Thermodesulfobacteriota bacterium]